MTRNHLIRTVIACFLVLSPVALAQAADVVQTFRQIFATASPVPHPAIVQVWAPDQEAMSRGSGTLIHVDGQFGYVITNWHVVRDAEKEVAVIFPDGHQSLARILKMNKDWDLALLLVWAGNEQPMPLAAMGPRPGDQLTIAGYGSGEFRAQSGKFSTFAAPQPDMPFEMFEVSVAARQGDSGGPIINQRGELVGVLFGAGDGHTTGTQIGRVRMFVNEAFAELSEQVQALAQQQRAAPNPTEPVQTAQQPARQATTENWLARDDVAAGQQYAAMPKDRILGNDAFPAATRPAIDSGAVASDLPSLVGEPQLSPATMEPTRFDPTIQIAEPPPAIAAVDQTDSPASKGPDAWQSYASGPSTSNSLPSEHAQDKLADMPVTDPLPSRHSVEVSRRDLFDRDEMASAHTNSATIPRPAALSSDHVIAPSPRTDHIPNQLSGGVTWEQIRSFFAAVGVFAVLHAIAKAIAGPAKKKKK